MCGIVVWLGDTEEAWPCLVNQINRRGPDENSSISTRSDVLLHASVLKLRGNVSQPVSSSTGGTLCFNGEIYGTPPNCSDTLAVLSLLEDVDQDTALLQALDQLEGEWSFIYHDTSQNRLIFARDSLGRRSLLVGRNTKSEQVSCVCSVGMLDDMLAWEEVNVDGLFQISLSSPHGEPQLAARRSQNVPTLLPSMEAESPTWLRLLHALEHSIRSRTELTSLGNKCTFSVLFSGGIDSVVIAAVCSRVMDPSLPIHLVNVAFHPDSPDRAASIDSFRELRQVMPDRDFRLVLVDPSSQDLLDDEDEILAHIAPKKSVMDFNIASVLWFGSKHAVGSVVLSGIGADELFGGYTRHRMASQRNGQAGLRAELNLDLSRLWTRNMGRDDRCISAHGKELRAPFLDRLVIDTIFTSPLDDLVDFNHSKAGLGDKRVLRMLAEELKLDQTSKRVKRAAQFGSRISKLIRPDLKGTDDFVLGKSFNFT